MHRPRTTVAFRTSDATPLTSSIQASALMSRGLTGVSASCVTLNSTAASHEAEVCERSPPLIALPSDVFQDFEALKSATKLDSSKLMRKLLKDYQRLSGIAHTGRERKLDAVIDDLMERNSAANVLDLSKPKEKLGESQGALSSSRSGRVAGDMKADIMDDRVAMIAWADCEDPCSPSPLDLTIHKPATFSPSQTDPKPPISQFSAIPSHQPTLAAAQTHEAHQFDGCAASPYVIDLESKSTVNNPRQGEIHSSKALDKAQGLLARGQTMLFGASYVNTANAVATALDDAQSSSLKNKQMHSQTSHMDMGGQASVEATDHLAVGLPSYSEALLQQSVIRQVRGEKTPSPNTPATMSFIPVVSPDNTEAAVQQHQNLSQYSVISSHYHSKLQHLQQQQQQQQQLQRQQQHNQLVSTASIRSSTAAPPQVREMVSTCSNSQSPELSASALKQSTLAFPNNYLFEHHVTGLSSPEHYHATPDNGDNTSPNPTDTPLGLPPGAVPTLFMAASTSGGMVAIPVIHALPEGITGLQPFAFAPHPPLHTPTSSGSAETLFPVDVSPAGEFKVSQVTSLTSDHTAGASSTLDLTSLATKDQRSGTPTNQVTPNTSRYILESMPVTGLESPRAKPGRPRGRGGRGSSARSPRGSTQNKDMKLVTENTLFPGVYTSILKLPWSRRSRNKTKTGVPAESRRRVAAEAGVGRDDGPSQKPRTEQTKIAATVKPPQRLMEMSRQLSQQHCKSLEEQTPDPAAKNKFQVENEHSQTFQDVEDVHSSSSNIHKQQHQQQQPLYHEHQKQHLLADHQQQPPPLQQIGENGSQQQDFHLQYQIRLCDEQRKLQKQIEDSYHGMAVSRYVEAASTTPKTPPDSTGTHTITFSSSEGIKQDSGVTSSSPISLQDSIHSLSSQDGVQLMYPSGSISLSSRPARKRGRPPKMPSMLSKPFSESRETMSCGQQDPAPEKVFMTFTQGRDLPFTKVKTENFESKLSQISRESSDRIDEQIRSETMIGKSEIISQSLDNAAKRELNGTIISTLSLSPLISNELLPLSIKKRCKEEEEKGKDEEGDGNNPTDTKVLGCNTAEHINDCHTVTSARPPPLGEAMAVDATVGALGDGEHTASSASGVQGVAQAVNKDCQTAVKPRRKKTSRILKSDENFMYATFKIKPRSGTLTPRRARRRRGGVLAATAAAAETIANLRKKKFHPLNSESTDKDGANKGSSVVVWKFHEQYPCTVGELQASGQIGGPPGELDVTSTSGLRLLACSTCGSILQPSRDGLVSLTCANCLSDDVRPNTQDGEAELRAECCVTCGHVFQKPYWDPNARCETCRSNTPSVISSSKLFALSKPSPAVAPTHEYLTTFRETSFPPHDSASSHPGPSPPPSAIQQLAPKPSSVNGGHADPHENEHDNIDDNVHPTTTVNRDILSVGGSRNDNLFCSLCRREFAQIYDYLSHIQENHTIPNDSSTPRTPAETSTFLLPDPAKKLKISKTKKSLSHKTITCPVEDCPMFFREQKDLDQHLNRKHAGVHLSPQSDHQLSSPAMDSSDPPPAAHNLAQPNLSPPDANNLAAKNEVTPTDNHEVEKEDFDNATSLVVVRRATRMASQLTGSTSSANACAEKPLQCAWCDYRCRQRNALSWHMRKHPEAATKHRTYK